MLNFSNKKIIVGGALVFLLGSSAITSETQLSNKGDHNKSKIVVAPDTTRKRKQTEEN